MFKKAIAIFMTVLMVTSALPMGIFAEETPEIHVLENAAEIHNHPSASDEVSLLAEDETKEGPFMQTEAGLVIQAEEPSVITVQGEEIVPVENPVTYGGEEHDFAAEEQSLDDEVELMLTVSATVYCERTITIYGSSSNKVKLYRSATATTQVDSGWDCYAKQVTIHALGYVNYSDRTASRFFFYAKNGNTGVTHLYYVDYYTNNVSQDAILHTYDTARSYHPHRRYCDCGDNYTTKKSSCYDCYPAKIYYNANGGTGGPSTQTVYTSSATIASTYPERFKYKFRGWSTNSSATTGTSSYDPGKSVSISAGGSLSLYAAWSPYARISADYAENSTTIEFPNTVGYFRVVPSESGTYVFQSTNDSGNPYCTLYDASGNTIKSNNNSGEGNNFKITADLVANNEYYYGVKWYDDSTGTIYVKSSREYDVEYKNNGGEGTFSPQTKLYDEGVTLHTNLPENFPKTFLGWGILNANTSPSNPANFGRIYLPGEEYSANENAVLYAVWRNAKNISTALPTTEQCTLTVPKTMRYFKFTPDESGNYIFKATPQVAGSAIYLYDENGNELAFIADSSSSSLDFYYYLTAGTTYYYGVKFSNASDVGTIDIELAKEITQYTVTYDYATNGGTSVSRTTATVISGEEADLSVEAYCDENTFLGWHTDPNATEPLTSYTVTDDVTLYAIFKEKGTEQVCGENLTWQLDSNGTLTISGTGAMYDWSDSAEVPWYAVSADIKQVVVEEGVTSVGDCAFLDCVNITSVSFADTVTLIGLRAMEGCVSLTDVTLSDNIVNLFNNMFFGCESLTSVVIPEGVMIIFESAFYGCENLKEVTIPASVEIIYDSAFNNCLNLTDVYYGGTEEEWLEVYIDNNNDPLYKANVTFSTALDSGTFGENFTWTLGKAGTLTITGTGAMPNWSSPSAAPWYDYHSNIKKLVIEEGVTSIGDAAFMIYEALTDVHIPNSLSSVGLYAFLDCNLLSDVYYNGSESEWSRINIKTGNEPILNAYKIFATESETHTITYNYSENGGTDVTQTTAEVPDGGEVDLSVTATKYGWDFVGWSMVPGDRVVYESLVASGDMTLYAVFKRDVTVTFYAGDKELQTSETVSIYNRDTEATITAPSPSAYDGWNGAGWRTDTAAGVPRYVSNATIAVSNDQVFYGIYSRSLTLTFDMNGNNDVAAPDPVHFTQNYNAFGVTSSCFTSMPYVMNDRFNCWAKDSVTGLFYQPGELVQVEENTVMYALWTAPAQEYTLTYRGRINGKSVVLPLKYAENTTVTLPEYPFEEYPVGAALTGYTINRTETKYPGDTLVMTADTRVDLNLTPQLVTSYITDKNMVSANYASYCDYKTSYRGFKFKEISENTYKSVTLESGSAFSTSLNNLEANREYECFAFDVIEIGDRNVTVNGTKITFKVKGKNLKLSESHIYLKPNGKYALSANIEGNSTIVWSSANNEIARVNNRGTVMAQGVSGTTVITASTEDGLYQARCTVTVDSGVREEFDFSEWNLAMRMSSNSVELNKSGLATEVYGANVMIGLAGLARWDGAVKESDDIYPVASTTAYNSEAEPEYHIQNAYMLPSKQGYKIYPHRPYDSANDNILKGYVDNVKRAVSRYGAVYAAFYAYEDSWNKKKTAFYNNDSDGAANGHAIVIVGWDDHYSKHHFGVTPPGDGAFICKNSYGTDKNQKGYFYISYYDAGLGVADHTMVFPGVGNVNNYDTIYEHDPFGAVDTMSAKNEIAIANVFTVNSATETLEAASFYTYDMATNYEIYVINDYQSAADLNNPGNVVASGSLDYAGYHTVKFNSIPLTGERFAVVVKLIKNGYDVHSYIEMPLSGNDIKAFYAKNARANSGESFAVINGSWVDLTTKFSNANNCIKAFTRGGSQSVSLMGNKVYESDAIMTISEAEQAGLHLNPAFKKFMAQDEVSLFDTGESLLIPSSAAFGSYTSNLTAGDIHNTYYNLNDYALVSAVKNQGAYNTCWAHAIYGSLESCMLKRIAQTGSALLNGGIGSEGSVGELINSDGFTAVGSVMLDESDCHVAIGQGVQLWPEIYPTSALNKEVSWVSSNPEVAIVDANGKVIPLAIGEAVITVITEDGNKTDQCVVNVTEAVQAETITFLNYGKNYSVGDKVFLPYEVQPFNAVSEGVTWETSNEDVATVSEKGLVTMMSVGETTITLTDKASGCQTSVTLYVNDGMPVHTTTTLKTVGDYYSLNFTVDNQVEGMQIMVSSYTADGRMLTMDSVSEDLLQVILEKNDEIAYFKTFVWSNDMEMLSKTEITEI